MTVTGKLTPHMILHTADLLGTFEVLFGETSLQYSWILGYVCQAVLHFGHSSNHNALNPNALNPKKIEYWMGEGTGDCS